ncbi:uncharacterized protein [Dysidea avara]|uniref:uncharacterized protein n=1 Tax=Dysidea avara TaxID=196820 RepID=UPI00331C1012
MGTVTPSCSRLSSPVPQRLCLEPVGVASECGESPAVMQVGVKYKKRPKSYYLTPRRYRIGKAVGRGCRKVIVQECIKDTITRKFLLEQLARLIKSELKALCSTKESNMLYQKTNEALNQFSWDQLMSELELKAPVLLYFKMSLVQRIISLILYSGHASKQVFQRLQRLNLCLSHQVTVTLVKSLGEDFDNQVLKWRKATTLEDQQEVDAIAEMCDMPGTCVFSSCSDESDCDSDQSEEGPTYSILTDNEVCDFDDISVCSQDDAPELAIDESLCSPFTNEEFETVLISTDPICSSTTTRGDETVLISADLIFSSTTTTRGDETVLISTDHICSSATTRDDETALISTDPICTATRNEETISRDPTNDDTVLIFGVPDAATVDERTVNPINNYKLMGDCDREAEWSDTHLTD